jgi:two-component system sensor histidine kinase FlrB
LKDLLTYIGDVGRMHAANRAIAVVIDAGEGLTATVDRSLMEGALLNLVLNAIDATPDGGTIQLRAVDREQMLHMEVQNAGPAIALEDLARVFEPFFTTKPAGTGLGLAIARGIARAHGGDLWVKTNAADAVTFTLAVPKNPSEDHRKELPNG